VLIEEFLRALSFVLSFAVPVFFAVVQLAVLVLVLVLPVLPVLPVLAVLVMLAVLAVLVQVSECVHIGAHRQHRVAEATQPPVVVIMAVLTMSVAVAVVDR
jgi:hypothetical protein